MSTLEVVGALGMALGVRLFVAASTLADLPALNDRLDRLPQNPSGWRYLCPFFYFGWGVRHEDERVDETTRSARGALLCPEGRCARSWRSEREWIERIRSGTAEPREVDLVINVDDDNIDALESMSCEAIGADYRARTCAAYAAIPSLAELCDRYGGRDGTKIYPLGRGIEMKWLDRHLLEHPIDFERQLTHLQMGN